MLRIGKLTDYAALVMGELAAEPQALLSAVELGTRARLEAPTVSKVLKILAQAGLVESRRGAAGGYRLARPAERITLADIVSALEGPIGMTECATHAGSCAHEPHCGARRNWRRVSDVIEHALREVTLAEMAPRRRRSIPITVLAEA